jgi:hypothetical protein
VSPRARAALAAAALALSLLAAGCGKPEKLSNHDGVAMGLAREDLDDALDTEETLRSSPGDGRRMVVRVRRILSEGSLETDPPDEFGLAALGRINQEVPSIVLTDEQGDVRHLDRPATRAFLRYAESDPPRALLGPVTGEVRQIVKVVEDSGAGPATRIPALDRRQKEQTVAAYLREAERDLRPVWPRLAGRLRAARGGL